MNARERLMLIAAIVLLGAVCFKFVIYDPQQAAHTSLVEARDAAAADLARNQRVLARADKVHAEYDRLTAFIATVEAKLPTSKEIPSLLTAMEQFTHRLGIGLDSFHPGQLESVTSTGTPATPSSGAGAARSGASAGEAPGKAVPYSRMQVTLSLTGTFAQVVEYLRELRGFPRLIVVESIALSPQSLPRLGASLTTEIYTLSPTPGASSGKPGAAPLPPAAPSSGAPAGPAATPPGAPGGGSAAAAPAKTGPSGPLRRPGVPEAGESGGQ